MKYDKYWELPGAAPDEAPQRTKRRTGLSAAPDKESRRTKRHMDEAPRSANPAKQRYVEKMENGDINETGQY